VIDSLTFNTTEDSQCVGISNQFNTAELIEIEYMAINGNDELIQMAEENDWPGAGYEWDPIIISGYYFRSEGHHFVVDNTDLYWEFRDNVLDGIDDRYCEIVIGNVRNGKIASNYFVRGAVGIHGIRISDCVFVGNEFYNQSWDGILLEYSNNNIIIGNTFIDEGEGGVLGWVDSEGNNIIYNEVYGSPFGFLFWDGSDGNTVKHNSIHDISSRGLDIQTANNVIKDNEIYNMDGDGIAVSERGTEIVDNLIYNGVGCGIQLYSQSGESIIENNVVIGFDRGGINLHESEHSRIEENDFYENSGIQAWDYGGNNIFTDNYWHEWIANDTDENGILDLPKLISGGNNIDPRPHAIPVNQIPAWYSFVPITGPPPESDSTSTSSTTTENPTVTESSSSTTTVETSSNRSTTDLSILFLSVSIGSASVLVVVLILIKRRS
jgi:parallel beta-helix repeat protein